MMSSSILQRRQDYKIIWHIFFGGLTLRTITKEEFQNILRNDDTQCRNGRGSI